MQPYFWIRALSREVTPGLALRRLAAVVAGLLVAACAGLPPPPPPDVAARAAATTSYSARLRVSLKGPQLRARTPVLLGFRRPDALRIEIPGPTGARLVAVTHAGTLTAVFPSERAVYAGRATADEMEALLGVGLAPSEVIDVLLGSGSRRLSRYVVRWGPALPKRIDATLPDGGRLRVDVEESEPGAALPDAAFVEPEHDGYRVVDAAEARELWGAR